jgi:hypothetical protein
MTSAAGASSWRTRRRRHRLDLPGVRQQGGARPVRVTCMLAGSRRSTPAAPCSDLGYMRTPGAVTVQTAMRHLPDTGIGPRSFTLEGAPRRAASCPQASPGACSRRMRPSSSRLHVSANPISSTRWLGSDSLVRASPAGAGITRTIGVSCTCELHHNKRILLAYMVSPGQTRLTRGRDANRSQRGRSAPGHRADEHTRVEFRHRLVPC